MVGSGSQLDSQGQIENDLSVENVVTKTYVSSFNPHAGFFPYSALNFI